MVVQVKDFIKQIGNATKKLKDKKIADAKTIHICNSHRLTHRPKNAKEYVLPTHKNHRNEKASCQQTLILHSAISCKYVVCVN